MLCLMLEAGLCFLEASDWLNGLSKLWEMVKDREAGRAAVHGVAKSQAWATEQQQIRKMGPEVGCWDEWILWCGTGESGWVALNPAREEGTLGCSLLWAAKYTFHPPGQVVLTLLAATEKPWWTHPVPLRRLFFSSSKSHCSPPSSSLYFHCCSLATPPINKLRYAGYTTLTAESGEELKSLLMRVKEESEEAGLKHNIKKLRWWHLVPSLHGK